MNSFVIRTYGRTELALLYSPNLLLQGGSARSRSYTPAQVGLIVAALGEP